MPIPDINLGSIFRNAAGLGTPDLRIVEGRAPEAMAGLPPPDAVFIGGGANQALLETVWKLLPDGARLVANAVLADQSLLRNHLDRLLVVQIRGRMEATEIELVSRNRAFAREGAGTIQNILMDTDH